MKKIIPNIPLCPLHIVPHTERCKGNGLYYRDYSGTGYACVEQSAAICPTKFNWIICYSTGVFGI